MCTEVEVLGKISILHSRGPFNNYVDVTKGKKSQLLLHIVMMSADSTEKH